MPELVRIQFADFDPDLEGWADIHARLIYASRLEVNVAAATSLVSYGFVRVRLYVENWSLDGSPADEKFVGALDNDLVTYLLNRAEAHYEEVRRDRAARKSDRAGAPGELRPDGDRPRDHLAPGERAVA